MGSWAVGAASRIISRRGREHEPDVDRPGETGDARPVEPSTPSSLVRRAWIRRIVRALFRVALGLLFLLAILTALVAHQAATLVHAGAEAEAKRFGEHIGRAVTVGPAHVEIGAVLSVQLDEIRIAAAPGQVGPAAAPLFEVAALRVRVPAWSIVRSFGKDLEVRSIEARGPVLRLVRLGGGELSYADVIERMAATQPPAESGRPARIGKVEITGARVELHDLSRDPEHGGVHLAVDRIDASTPLVRTEAPLDVTLDAAVLASERNLHLEIGFAPRDAPRGALLGHLRRVALRLSGVVVDPLVPFIPVRGGLGVAGATVSADLGLAVDPRGPITFQGSATAAALRLLHDDGGQEGSPVDVTARADVAVDPEVPSLEVRSLTVSAGGMSVEGRADVRGPVAAPEVRALDVHTRDVTFERLLALLPASWIPRGVSLGGPVELRARAHGPPRAAEIDVTADLGGARVALLDLDKPAGVALSAELYGRVRRQEGAEAGGLEIDSLGLRLGPLALTLRGRVKDASDADLTFDSGEVAIEPLLRLLPAVVRGVPAGTTLGGQFQASGRVLRMGETTSAQVQVALKRAAVKTAALTLEGDANLDATLRSSPAVESLAADVEGVYLRVNLPGRFDKARGAPLQIHASAERAGAVTTVRRAELTLAGARVSGHARHDAAAHTLKLDAPECELDLPVLARSMPALAGLPAALAAARLRGGVSFSGDPRAPGGGDLLLSNVEASGPFGRLRGTLDLHGLSPVHAFTFDVSGGNLDLDALPGSGDGGGGAAPALDAVQGRGRVHLERIRAGGVDARDLDAEIELAQGTLALPTLRLSALGGRFQASGSHVDLARSPRAFALRARAERIDLAALSAARGGTPGELSGRLDADVSLDGAGADWAAVSPTLAGTVAVSVDGAHVHGKHTMRGTIVNPLIGKLAEHARQQHPVREVDTHIERAQVTLRVAGGKITTPSPLVMHTDEGTLTFDGTVGFDRSLAIDGSVVIPPATIEKATKGLLVPYGDATLKLRIGGTSDAPRIQLVDLESTVKALRGSWIRGIEKKIEHALGKD